LEVAAQRLGDLARVDLPVGDLHRVVAVGLDGADLGDDVRTGLHDGHGDELSVLVPDLGHAELGAEHAGHRSGLLAGQFVAHVHHPQSLISMLTSAGRSRRMSESTAFGVGSTMSIRRLCVRISKCSRESLYLCGERITQNTFFSVGSGTGPTTVAPALVTVSTILRAELSITSWSYDLSRMRIFCPAMASCLSSSSGMDAAAPGTRGRASAGGHSPRWPSETGPGHVGPRRHLEQSARDEQVRQGGPGCTPSHRGASGPAAPALGGSLRSGSPGARAPVGRRPDAHLSE